MASGLQEALWPKKLSKKTAFRGWYAVVRYWASSRACCSGPNSVAVNGAAKSITSAGLPADWWTAIRATFSTRVTAGSVAATRTLATPCSVSTCRRYAPDRGARGGDCQRDTSSGTLACHVPSATTSSEVRRCRVPTSETSVGAGAGCR